MMDIRLEVWDLLHEITLMGHTSNTVQIWWLKERIQAILDKTKPFERKKTMPDTGKMKRLFNDCVTGLPGMDPTMDYPEGDLDGIAEQILLRIDRLEVDLEKQQEIIRGAERRVAYVVGEVRRAQKSLDGALKGSV